MFFRQYTILLTYFVIFVHAKSSQTSFWDEFPQLWRAVYPRSSTQGAEVSYKNNFDSWVNSQATTDVFSTSLSAHKFHARVNALLSSDPKSGNSSITALRIALMSLGALGNVQPQIGADQYTFATFYPEFQSSTSEKDWWRGSNVCVNREEFDLSKNQNLLLPSDVSSNVVGHSSSCDFSEDSEAYVCITDIHRSDFHRRYIVKYQCCYGFSRVPGTFGCTKAYPITRLTDTLKNLRLTSFSQTVADAGMSSFFDSGNYTIFAPSNEAFEKLQPSVNNNEIDARASVASNNMRATLRSHVVNGFLRGSSITDDQTVDSLDGSMLRLNLFATPTRVFTVNCARVISANNAAINGVVHVVDSVLHPVTDTLAGSLRKDGRLGSWMALLSDAGLLDELSRLDGEWTLLVPTDAALRAMDRNFKRRLSNDKNCLKRVLQTHILPKVLCSTVIENLATTKNFLNRTIRFVRSGKDLTVENQTILSSDHIARNGVFFVLNGVIIPEEVKSLLQIAADAGLTSFLGMVAKSDLSSNIEEMNNVTIFVPSNRAVEKMPESVRRQVGTSAQSISDILTFQMVQPAVMLSDFKDNLEMSTVLSGSSLRMNIYETFPYGKKIFTVNCAKILIGNFRGCNGNIHVLDRVLLPITGNVLQILRSSGNYSTFLNALNSTGLDGTLAAASPITVFAPSDQAFSSLAPDDQKVLFSNSSLLHSVLELHILPRELCCAGVMEDSMFFGQYTRSMNAHFSLPLHRSRAGEIRIAGSTVEQCDIVATNGVIHTINKIIFPKNFL